LGQAYVDTLENARAWLRGYNDKTTPLPEELVDFLLCERFGWTEAELEATSRYRRQVFFDLMMMKG